MNRPPRVLLLVENLPIARDHRLRKQAASLLSEGFEVTVICRRDSENDRVPGITLRDYPAPSDARTKVGYVREYGWSLLMAGWQVVRSLLAEGFDIIQVASTPDIYFLVTIPLRALGKRVVFDARDLSPEIFARRFGGNRRIVLQFLRALERMSFRSADQVVAVNESVAAVARERAQISPCRITLVGNGPLLRDLTATRPHVKDEGDDAPLMCCFVGMMGPQDGVDVALKAVAQLVHGRKRTDTRFIFAGTGDVLPAMQALVDELQLSEWVSFPGWVTPEQLVTLLRRADVGLEPNLEDFVSPVKVMEYMGHGLPVVAFDLRETAAIVGSSGLLAPPGDVKAFADCIESLLDHPEARSALGSEGQRRVRTRLAWDHQALRYLNMYRGLANSNGTYVTIRQESA